MGHLLEDGSVDWAEKSIELVFTVVQWKLGSPTSVVAAAASNLTNIFAVEAY